MKLCTSWFASTFIAGLVAASGAQATSFSSLVIFGDGLSDSGNNAILMQIGVNPPANVLGNSYLPYRPYASGTYSNGPVWSTQFAAMLGLEAKPSMGPDGGSNYAYGNAKTGDDPEGLLQQLKLYQQRQQKPGAIAADKTLFVVAGGSNDARTAVMNFSAASSPVYGASAPVFEAARQSAANTKAIVDQLQAAGAEHIVVWNVADQGLTPHALGWSRYSTDATFASKLFNAELENALADETSLQRYNLFGLTASLPAGTFSNVTDACGAASNSSVCPADIAHALYWDSIYPTTAAHGFIAQQMYALVSAPVPEPLESVMLVAGLLVLGTAVRRRMH